MPTILAGTAATLTDSRVNGDLHVSPGEDLTQTRSSVSGAIHLDDAEAGASRAALDAEFAALASRPRGKTLVGTLAGQTLAPGVYDFDAAATLTGVVELSGAGDFLIRVGAALTATSFEVRLAAGADGARVIWRALAAVTLTDCEFAGRVLAGAAATVTRGSLAGQVLSRAAVTLTGTQVG